FEYRQSGKLVVSKGQMASSGSAKLRLERKDDEIFASFSEDGAKWVDFPILPVAFDDDLEIGLVAINSATKPLVVQYQDFKLTQTPVQPAKDTSKDGGPAPP